MNLIQKRYLYFLISGIIIIPGIIALILWGLPLAIDFTGGSLLEVSFTSGTVPQPSQVVTFLEQNGIPGAEVQTTGNNSLTIRSKQIDTSTETELVAKMETQYNATITVLQFNSVGPSVGQEVTNGAAVAVSS